MAIPLVHTLPSSSTLTNIGHHRRRPQITIVGYLLTLAVSSFVGALSYVTKLRWLSFEVLGDDACSVATFDLLLYMLGSMFVAADFDVGRLCRWRLAEYWFADGVGGYWLVVCYDRGT